MERTAQNVWSRDWCPTLWCRHVLCFEQMGEYTRINGELIVSCAQHHPVLHIRCMRTVQLSTHTHTPCMRRPHRGPTPSDSSGGGAPGRILPHTHTYMSDESRPSQSLQRTTHGVKFRISKFLQRRYSPMTFVPSNNKHVCV